MDWSQIISALISGLLGGTFVAIVNYLLLRRKTQAEIRNIEENTNKTVMETREISLRLESLSKRIPTSLRAPDITEFVMTPVHISSDQRNRIPISSKFLQWRKATILLWVYVPPRGKGLRDINKRRYIIGHITDKSESPYPNRFSFGCMNDERVWDLALTNDKRERMDIKIPDKLEPGWHQFHIAWNLDSQYVEVRIDGTGAKNFAENIGRFWPKAFADQVMVGSWTTGQESRYSNTYLSRLEIYHDFLIVTDQEVINHLESRPDFKVQE